LGGILILEQATTSITLSEPILNHECLQKESSSGYESWLAVSSVVGCLLILIIVVIVATIPNASDQDWILVAATFMLWGAPSFGAIMIVLGLKLKNRSESIASYGVVIGIGALVIFLWFAWWGVPFL